MSLSTVFYEKKKEVLYGVRVFALRTGLKMGV